MELIKLLLSMVTFSMNPACNGQMASLYDINLSNYSKISAPYLNDKSKTVDVNVSMYILNIGNLDTAQMTFEVEMYFGMKWTDPRLAFKEYNNATYAMVKGLILIPFFPQQTKLSIFNFIVLWLKISMWQGVDLNECYGSVQNLLTSLCTRRLSKSTRHFGSFDIS